MSSQPRYPGLDGLRGLAILAVLIAHAARPGQPGFALLGNGRLGVDLFFALSGFLITGILVDARGAPGYFRAFYARRALRILPLYYGVVAVLVFVRPALPVLDGNPSSDAVAQMQAWYWLHVSNWFLVLHPTSVLPQGTVPLWSLAVEEQFYLVWPFIVWWLSPRQLVRLCCGLAVFAFAWRFWAAWNGWHIRTLRFATFSVMDTLALGSALAVLWRQEAARARIARLAPLVLLLAVVLVVLLLAPWDGRPFTPRAPLFFTLTAVGAASFLGTVLTSPWTWRWLDAGPLPAVGRVSYGMYILHFFLLGVLFHAGVRSSLGLILSGIVVTYLAALIIWHALERPCLALKRFVPMPRLPQMYHAQVSPQPAVPSPAPITLLGGRAGTGTQLDAGDG
jgi:peptidoglycan/LPS O-acetylase OafA/YrhL